VTRFHRRITLLRLTACSMAFLLFACSSTVGVLELTTKTLPLSFAIFLVIIIIMAFLVVVFTSLVRPRDKRLFFLKPFGTSVPSHKAEIKTKPDDPDPDSMRVRFSLLWQGPKLRTIAEASETSRWSQVA
jgi:hypothetical protein